MSFINEKMVMRVAGIFNYECSEEMYEAIIIILYMSFFS